MYIYIYICRYHDYNGCMMLTPIYTVNKIYVYMHTSRYGSKSCFSGRPRRWKAWCCTTTR